MIKRFKQFGIVAGIYLMVSLTLGMVEAQAQPLSPEAGVRISWPANPSAEAVERYIVSWQDGAEWRVIDDVAHVDDQQLSLTTRVTWLKSILEVGERICFRVVAVRGDESSDPSDSCGVIPENLSGVVVISLQPPGALEIQWLEATQ